jgi:YD repeat-containing protein
MALPGRGLAFQFKRTYRSALSDHVGPLGRGGTFSYAKSLEEVGNRILFHDGMGNTFNFTKTTAGRFVSPDGFYSVLIEENNEFILQQRYGTRFAFEPPQSGGRLLYIETRNHNRMTFQYGSGTLQVTDPLLRTIKLNYEDGRLIGLQDHADRTWQYRYDNDDCLIEVIRPPIDEFPNGTRVQYNYDNSVRLESITDPKGQTFLIYEYDDSGRVSTQRHGGGGYRFDYQQIGQNGRNFPTLQTDVVRKNGRRLVLTHDESGHVIELTLHLSRDSLSEEDRGGNTDEFSPLTTRSTFNRHGKVIKRTFPTGNTVEWIFDEDDEDPRQLGNLLQITKCPDANNESDQDRIATTFTITNEPRFQRHETITDPRGHTIKFEYDQRGNLLKKIYPPVAVQLLEPGGTHSFSEDRGLVEQQVGKTLAFSRKVADVPLIPVYVPMGCR